MTIRIDPENNEINTLLSLAEFNGRHVLEIGCGEGRLTQRYAGRAKRVTAIDAFEKAIIEARENLPDELRGSVEFHPIAFEDFANATQPSTFDTVILSWSL